MTTMRRPTVSDCSYPEYDVVEDITATFAKLRTILSEEATTRKKLNELFMKQKEEAETAVRKAQEHLAFVNDEQANMRDTIKHESEAAKEAFNHIALVQPCPNADDQEREPMERKKKEEKDKLEERIRQMEEAEQAGRWRLEEKERQVMLARRSKEQRIQNELCVKQELLRIAAEKERRGANDRLAFAPSSAKIQPSITAAGGKKMKKKAEDPSTLLSPVQAAPSPEDEERKLMERRKKEDKIGRKKSMDLEAREEAERLEYD